MPIAPSERFSVQLATTTLTPAQVATLASSPVILVPAQGAGRAVVPICGIIALGGGTAGYGQPSAAFALIAQGASDEWLATGNVGLQDIAGGAADMASAAHTWPNADIANVPLTIAANSDPSLAGVLLTATVDADNAGSGYSVNDTGVVDSSGGGANAAYKVLTVSAGAVQTVQITSGGNGFSVGTECATSVATGGGDGALGLFPATITPQSDLPLFVTCLYYIATV